MTKKELFVELNSALTIYIGVHESVLNQKLFQQVDHAGLFEILEGVTTKINVISNSMKQKLSIDDHRVTAEYISTLLLAINQLKKIIKGLRSKTENTGKYGFFDYQRDLKTYKALVKGYLEYGSAMNAIFTGL